ncbi:hypothetical protein BHM03_00049762 [Ensete ventricosum]|nr:hypothetical protein BHM03_00049762 [Ensete ventricosum]
MREGGPFANFRENKWRILSSPPHWLDLSSVPRNGFRTVEVHSKQDSLIFFDASPPARFTLQLGTRKLMDYLHQPAKQGTDTMSTRDMGGFGCRELPLLTPVPCPCLLLITASLSPSCCILKLFGDGIWRGSSDFFFWACVQNLCPTGTMESPPSSLSSSAPCKLQVAFGKAITSKYQSPESSCSGTFQSIYRFLLSLSPPFVCHLDGCMQSFEFLLLSNQSMICFTTLLSFVQVSLVRGTSLSLVQVS